MEGYVLGKYSSQNCCASSLTMSPITIFQLYYSCALWTGAHFRSSIYISQKPSYMKWTSSSDYNMKIPLFLIMNSLIISSTFSPSGYLSSSRYVYIFSASSNDKTGKYWPDHKLCLIPFITRSAALSMSTNAKLSEVQQCSGSLQEMLLGDAPSLRGIFNCSVRKKYIGPTAKIGGERLQETLVCCLNIRPMVQCSSGSRGGSRVSTEPPFWAWLTWLSTKSYW